MRHKFKLLAIFYVGVGAGVAAILYLRIHDPKYGFDIIADRIIPFGIPSLSAAAALVGAINYQRRIWVPASVFPTGVLLSIIVTSLYYSYSVSLESFTLTIAIFLILYVSGIVGAFAGKKLSNFKRARS